ncbi:primary replicative DNA helicase [Psychromonas ingrahamii 37]|uniref:Replicative DNA helicase n=1 Tax=Psychromonas ingrahamii (strain DSM 17664 / CCUG 51855 / 37) TaxID=357804 RepID=A1SRE5_PSYIN|nr:replicative DNA helicase [Psychromonas ingrahamii]ABM02060.1 primary replicative DNA helicase [Psychromonas ingrahamii 37]
MAGKPPFSQQKPKINTPIKTVPHSFEAEQAIIGGLLLNNEAWNDVAERVVERDFYHRAHRQIFAMIERLSSEDIPVDLVTLSEHLENKKELEGVGGIAYLAELLQNTPSAANINNYSDIVRERAIVRELIGVANEIAEAGYETEGRDSNELLDFAETRVFQIAESRSNKSEGPQAIKDILKATVAKIDDLCKNPRDGITGLSSGYNDLDQMTTGFQAGDLIIVAARPSMGKTTFAMNLAEHAALNADKPTVIFSLEMPAEQIMNRILSSLGRIDQGKIRTGQLDENDWASLSSTMSILLQKGNMFIDDSSGLTPTELRSRARRIARDHGGVSLIMVDYLQLMRVPSLSENRTLEISEISRSLKALAKELRCPVIALSQLNRGLEQRADKRPINSDLRESGAIEQDADLIMFIYRDEIYNEASEHKGIAEIIIGKQRNGPIGKVRLTFQGRYSRFDEYTGTAYHGED